MAKRSGRPCKLTPAIEERICACLAMGLPRVEAATQAGIGYGTLRRWERKGQRQSRGRFRTFWTALKRAEAEAVEFFVTAIRSAAANHDEQTVKVTHYPDGSTKREVTERKGVREWTAAAWMLERRWASEFGRKESAEIAALKAQVAELAKQLRATVGPHSAGSYRNASA